MSASLSAFAEDDGRGHGCPTGKSPKSCPAQVAKIFRFAFDPNHFYKPRCLAPSQRGVSRSSRTLARDAMDAGLSKDERQASRTAKPYGPGAPTLASSLRGNLQATVATKPVRTFWQILRTQECEISRKTIACGNAGLIRWTCGDYTRVLLSFAREAAGASPPGIPHALTGRKYLSELGRIAPRECPPPSLRGANGSRLRRAR
jgi:hypothetical protein